MAATTEALSFPAALDGAFGQLSLTSSTLTFRSIKTSVPIAVSSITALVSESPESLSVTLQSGSTHMFAFTSSKLAVTHARQTLVALAAMVFPDRVPDSVRVGDTRIAAPSTLAELRAYLLCSDPTTAYVYEKLVCSKKSPSGVSDAVFWTEAGRRAAVEAFHEHPQARGRPSGVAFLDLRGGAVVVTPALRDDLVRCSEFIDQMYSGCRKRMPEPRFWELMFDSPEFRRLSIRHLGAGDANATDPTRRKNLDLLDDDARTHLEVFLDMEKQVLSRPTRKRKRSAWNPVLEQPTLPADLVAQCRSLPANLPLRHLEEVVGLLNHQSCSIPVPDEVPDDCDPVYRAVSIPKPVPAFLEPGTAPPTPLEELDLAMHLTDGDGMARLSALVKTGNKATECEQGHGFWYQGTELPGDVLDSIGLTCAVVMELSRAVRTGACDLAQTTKYMNKLAYMLKQNELGDLNAPASSILARALASTQ